MQEKRALSTLKKFFENKVQFIHPSIFKEILTTELGKSPHNSGRLVKQSLLLLGRSSELTQEKMTDLFNAICVLINYDCKDLGSVFEDISSLENFALLAKRNFNQVNGRTSATLVNARVILDIFSKFISCLNKMQLNTQEIATVLKELSLLTPNEILKSNILSHNSMNQAYQLCNKFLALNPHPQEILQLLSAVIPLIKAGYKKFATKLPEQLIVRLIQNKNIDAHEIGSTLSLFEKLMHSQLCDVQHVNVINLLLNKLNQQKITEPNVKEFHKALKITGKILNDFKYQASAEQGVSSNKDVDHQAIDGLVIKLYMSKKDIKLDSLVESLWDPSIIETLDEIGIQSVASEKFRRDAEAVKRQFKSLLAGEEQARAEDYATVLSGLAQASNLEELTRSIATSSWVLSQFLESRPSAKVISQVILALVEISQNEYEIHPQILKDFAHAVNDKMKAGLDSIAYTLWGIAQLSEVGNAFNDVISIYDLNGLIQKLHKKLDEIPQSDRTCQSQSNTELEKYSVAFRAIGKLLNRKDPQSFEIDLEGSVLSSMVNKLANQSKQSTWKLVESLWGKFDTPMREKLYAMDIRVAGFSELDTIQNLTFMHDVCKIAMKRLKSLTSNDALIKGAGINQAVENKRNDSSRDKVFRKDYKELLRRIVIRYMSLCCSYNLYYNAVKIFDTLKKIPEALSPKMINEFMLHAVKEKDFVNVLWCAQYLANSVYCHYDILELQGGQVFQILNTLDILKAALKSYIEHLEESYIIQSKEDVLIPLLDSTYQSFANVMNQIEQERARRVDHKCANKLEPFVARINFFQSSTPFYSPTYSDLKLLPKDSVNNPSKDTKDTPTLR